MEVQIQQGMCDVMRVRWFMFGVAPNDQADIRFVCCVIWAQPCQIQIVAEIRCLFFVEQDAQLRAVPHPDADGSAFVVWASVARQDFDAHRGDCLFPQSCWNA